MRNDKMKCPAYLIVGGVKGIQLLVESMNCL